MERNVLLEDMENCLNSEVNWNEFRYAKFLITGATGLIGSLMVKMLLYANEKLALHMKIYAFIRDEGKAKKIYKEQSGRINYIIGDLSDLQFNLEEGFDYIIHAAAITMSWVMIEKPVDVIETALNSTRLLLTYLQKHIECKMVYISSMEMYGTVDNEKMVDETCLGYIDLHSVRSCYPESKRMCECMCNSFVSQYGVKVCSARLAQTFGSGVLPGENRVFAQFARSVINHNDIVLHTDGLSEGNYVYTLDAVKAILLLLLQGKSGEAYNIANEASHVTIKEMAELVARQIAQGQIKVVYDIPVSQNKYGYAPKVKLNLSSDKIRALGWLPNVGLVDAYNRMIMYMCDNA